MIRKTKSIILTVLIFISLVGCSPDSINSEIYNGRPLTIGVVGDIPDVRENIITFQSLELTAIKEKSVTEKLDAVFIMKDFLIEASNDEYVNVYQTVGIPFFFIESTKSYTPFVAKGISYNDVPTIKDKSYATGYQHRTENEGYYWSFGLYNDKINKNNIADAYTRIFETILSSTQYASELTNQ